METNQDGINPRVSLLVFLRGHCCSFLKEWTSSSVELRDRSNAEVGFIQ